MTEQRLMHGWNVNVRGGLRNDTGRFTPEVTLSGGVERQMTSYLTLEMNLAASLCGNGVLGGPLSRLRFMPLAGLPGDVAVTTSLGVGVHDGDFSGGGEVGIELGWTLSPAGKKWRMFSGVASGMATAGPAWNWEVFAGLAVPFSFTESEPDMSSTVDGASSVEAVFPVLEQKRDKIETAEELKARELLENRRLMHVSEDQKKFSEAKQFALNVIRLNPTESYANYVFFALMEHYGPYRIYSREAVDSLQLDLHFIIENHRLDEFVSGVRLFLQKTGEGITEQGGKSCINVPIVMADVLSLLQTNGGHLDRATFKAFAVDRYFVKDERGRILDVKPRIYDALYLFVGVIYLASMQTMKIDGDAFDDAGLSVAQMLRYLSPQKGQQ